MSLFTHPADEQHKYVKGRDGCAICGEGVMYFLHWRGDPQPEQVLVWYDLSDSELRAKLEQRGVDPEHAAELVRHREEAADAIEVFLGT